MTTAVALERLVLDALPATVCAVDLDGRITFVNRQWTRSGQVASPIPVDDVVGSYVWTAMPDIAPREQMERAFAVLREGRAQSLTWEVPLALSDQDQSAVVQVSAMHDGHSVVGFVVSSLDASHNGRWRDRLLDTVIALSSAVSADRVFLELARQLRRTMGCEALAIAT